VVVIGEVLANTSPVGGMLADVATPVPRGGPSRPSAAFGAWSWACRPVWGRGVCVPHFRGIPSQATGSDSFTPETCGAP